MVLVMRNWPTKLAIVACLCPLPFCTLSAQNQQRSMESPKNSAEARSRGEAILAAAVDAAGGGALTKLQSLEFKLRKQASTPQGTSASSMHLWVVYPNKIRIEECAVEDWLQGGRPAAGTQSGSVGMPTRRSGPVTPMRREEKCTDSYAEGTDGITAWRRTPKGTVQLSLADSPGLSFDLFGPMMFYRWAVEEKLEPSFVGTHQLHGRELLSVEIRVPPTKIRAFKETETQVFGGRLTLYVDPETDLIAGVSFSASITEPGTQVVEVWDDYHRTSFEFEGREYRIQFPLHWATYRDGSQTIDARVENLRLNRQPSSKIFARP